MLTTANIKKWLGKLITLFHSCSLQSLNSMIQRHLFTPLLDSCHLLKSKNAGYVEKLKLLQLSFFLLLYLISNWFLQIIDAIISHGCFLRECSVQHSIVGVRSRLEYGVELKVSFPLAQVHVPRSEHWFIWLWKKHTFLRILWWWVRITIKLKRRLRLY